MTTQTMEKSLHIRHPDTLYQAVTKLFNLCQQRSAPPLVAATQQLAKVIYQAYPVDAPILIAHLSLHNDHYSLSVNEALNCAILTCALGYQQHWSAHTIVTLICAALTKDIADLRLSDQRVDGTRFSAADNQQWRCRGERAKQLLQRSGVSSKLWLEAVAEHTAKMDGSGYPATAGFNLSPASRLLSWTSFFAEQICPRGNRTGLRPRQIIRYGLGSQRLAFDRKFITDTARIFAPIQPGAVIKTEDDKLGIVIGRQNRHEAIITAIASKDLDIQQCNIKSIARRYPTQIEQSRLFLARLIRGWQQLQEQSVSLLDGLQIPVNEGLSPEKIAEVSYLFDLAEPDIPALAALLTEYPALLARLAEQAQRLSRRQQRLKQPKQILMMLGLTRASALVQRNAMLLALQQIQGPYHGRVSALVDGYSEFTALLAARTRFADPEKARIIATAQCAGLLLCHELSATRPVWLAQAAERPSRWLKTSDSPRLDSLALAFAKRWQLAPFAINALALSADRATPTASRKALGYSHLLRLASLLYQHLEQTGQISTAAERVQALANALSIDILSLEAVVHQFSEQCHPYTVLD